MLLDGSVKQEQVFDLIDTNKFTFDVLKEEYGIYAIRGPRGIMDSLSAALK